MSGSVEDTSIDIVGENVGGSCSEYTSHIGMNEGAENTSIDIVGENVGGSCSEYTSPIGMQFDSEEDAYKFYNEHGGKRGFGIRRDNHTKSKKDGVITSRKFCCSKEGKREEDKRTVKKHRAETRTECKAFMHISLNRKIQKYVVTKWDDNHNHLLHITETVHMIRSQRRVSVAQGIDVEMAEKSGISLKRSYELMSTQAGGRDSLGFTRLDQKNYLRTKRQRALGSGEAGSLLEYFQTQAAINPSFEYAIQLDQQELITNIFWADPGMIIDYGHFGDVVSFDTTFRTNKEYRPLAVFAGFNNFRETVIFGAALLYDETTESFEWLFKTFLDVMSGKKPITIFTDQDQAMGNAISKVIPETYHALCSWHIMKNALKNLCHLFKEGSNFYKDFGACMFNYETETELIKAWEMMIDSYELQNNTWIAEKWAIREKWARVYLKRTFTGGMRSTQLSESVNSTLRNYLQPDHDIPHFLNHFDRFVFDKRYRELEAIYYVRDKQPELTWKSPLMLQAGQVYTPNVLKLFQNEHEKSLCCIVNQCHDSEEEYKFIVSFYGSQKEYFVDFNQREMTIYCTCHKFEMIGILCSHALKVLNRMNIMEIPESYILKRWRQDARDCFTHIPSFRVEEDDPKLVAASRYRELCHMSIQLATRCSTDEHAFQIVKEGIIELFKRVENMFKSNSNLSVNTKKDARLERTSPLEPIVIQAKGFKKKENGYKGWRRPKPWYEKGAKGGKKRKQKTESCKTISNNQIPKSVSKQNSCLQESLIPSEVLEVLPNIDLMNQEQNTPYQPSASYSQPLFRNLLYAPHPPNDDNFYDFLGTSVLPSTKH